VFLNTVRLSCSTSTVKGPEGVRLKLQFAPRLIIQQSARCCDDDLAAQPLFLSKKCDCMGTINGEGSTWKRDNSKRSETATGGPTSSCRHAAPIDLAPGDSTDSSLCTSYCLLYGYSSTRASPSRSPSVVGAPHAPRASGSPRRGAPPHALHGTPCSSLIKFSLTCVCATTTTMKRPDRHRPPPIAVASALTQASEWSETSGGTPLTPSMRRLVHIFPSPGTPKASLKKPNWPAAMRASRESGTGVLRRPTIHHENSSTRPKSARVRSGALPLSPPPESIPEDTVWPPPLKRQHRRSRDEQFTHPPLDSSTEPSSASESESEPPRGRPRRRSKERKRRSRTQSSEALPASDCEASSEAESESEPLRGRQRHRSEERPRARTRSHDTLPLWDRSRVNAQEHEDVACVSNSHREEEARPTSSPVRAVTPEGFRMHPGTPIENSSNIWAPPHVSHLHYASRRQGSGSVRNESPPSDSSQDSLTALPPLPHRNHEATIPLEKARAKVRKNPSRYRASGAREKRRRLCMWFVAGLVVRLHLFRLDRS
jgi:hypothetical protein